MMSTQKKVALAGSHKAAHDGVITANINRD
jgi:hypothetical protein